ncbi:hypothetical protein BGY98DRAFT_476330 [Russula aff. rugulosa BPL654]|nr:hypothetical protein BGY98DRAFT_476330 [Russula aff. rugulosa BPL654]
MLGDIKSIAWDGTGALRQQGPTVYRSGGSAVSTLRPQASGMIGCAAAGVSQGRPSRWTPPSPTQAGTNNFSGRGLCVMQHRHPISRRFPTPLPAQSTNNQGNRRHVSVTRSPAHHHFISVCFLILIDSYGEHSTPHQARLCTTVLLAGDQLRNTTHCPASWAFLAFRVRRSLISREDHELNDSFINLWVVTCTPHVLSTCRHFSFMAAVVLEMGVDCRPQLLGQSYTALAQLSEIQEVASVGMSINLLIGLARSFLSLSLHLR